MKKPNINKMTLREKVAQTLVVRQSDLMLRADKAYDELRDPSEAKEILDRNQFGGIWIHGNHEINYMSPRYTGYFNFTVESLLKWIDDNTRDILIPPICANDPIGNKLVPELTKLSTYNNAIIVGAADSEEYAFELGKCIAEEHKAVGLNWLWSPVADLNNRFSAGISRAFSNKKDQLIRMLTAYIKGMQSVNVAATIKHYPGVDPKETRDGHIVTTMINTPLDEWLKEQGAVFQAAIDAGVYSVMSSGFMYPAMDDEKVGSRYTCAGFSKKMTTDMLKEKMGFDGVVITDDVTMGSYTSYYDSDEIYGRFLEAGHDVLLGVGIDALDKVMACVEKGIVSEERITDACRRVLDLKEKVGLFDDDYTRNCGDIKEITSKTKNVSEKIARDGITLLRDRIGLLPMKKKINHVTIHTFSHAEGIYDSLNAMKEAFEERGAVVELKRRPESFEEIQEAAEKSDLIIYAGYIGFHAPKGAPSFYGDEFWSFRYAFTAGKEKSIGISLGYPFIHHYFMDDADVFVNLYSPDDAVQKAFVAAVYGESEFKGVPPLDMNVDN